VQSAVYLSDGETWDTVEGCELVFYDNEEWGDGPKRSSKKSMDLQAVVDQAIVSRAAVRRLASALAGWSYAIESAAAWRTLTPTEKTILYNAGLLSAAARDVLRGEVPADLTEEVDTERTVYYGQ
jgi:hypothetical protein